MGEGEGGAANATVEEGRGRGEKEEGWKGCSDSNAFSPHHRVRGNRGAPLNKEEASPQHRSGRQQRSRRASTRRVSQGRLSSALLLAALIRPLRVSHSFLPSSVLLLLLLLGCPPPCRPRRPTATAPPCRRPRRPSRTRWPAPLRSWQPRSGSWTPRSPTLLLPPPPPSRTSRPPLPPPPPPTTAPPPPRRPPPVTASRTPPPSCSRSATRRRPSTWSTSSPVSRSWRPSRATKRSSRTNRRLLPRAPPPSSSPSAHPSSSSSMAFHPLLSPIPSSTLPASLALSVFERWVQDRWHDEDYEGMDDAAKEEALRQRWAIIPRLHQSQVAAEARGRPPLRARAAAPAAAAAAEPRIRSSAHPAAHAAPPPAVLLLLPPAVTAPAAVGVACPAVGPLLCLVHVSLVHLCPLLRRGVRVRASALPPSRLSEPARLPRSVLPRWAHQGHRQRAAQPVRLLPRGAVLPHQGVGAVSAAADVPHSERVPRDPLAGAQARGLHPNRQPTPGAAVAALGLRGRRAYGEEIPQRLPPHSAGEEEESGGRLRTGRPDPVSRRRMEAQREERTTTSKTRRATTERTTGTTGTRETRWWTTPGQRLTGRRRGCRAGLGLRRRRTSSGWRRGTA